VAGLVRLVPAIHDFLSPTERFAKDVGGRNKSGHGDLRLGNENKRFISGRTLSV
jgi:hypothetical protein